MLRDFGGAKRPKNRVLRVFLKEKMILVQGFLVQGFWFLGKGFGFWGRVFQRNFLVQGFFGSRVLFRRGSAEKMWGLLGNFSMDFLHFR